jgi:quaternary ammonium compound-resistance protein SugE
MKDRGTIMSWIILILAGAAEIIWAVALKYADGFTRIIPSVITVVGYIASLVLLSMAMKRLPLGTSYAVWTGIGIVGTTVLGIFLFQEKLSPLQVICVAMIVIGIIGLKLSSR